MLLVKEADVLRPFDDLLQDDAFWRQFEIALARDVTPLFFETFVAGAVAGSTVASTKTKAFPSDLPDPLSAEEIADLAEEAIKDYVPEFTKNISQTTYESVRSAVMRSRETGTGIEGVLRDISPLFSRSRAELIGVTETTRLFGIGAQASYRLQGFNAWQWMAVNDPWVDPVCAGLASDSEAKPFPIDELFSPAHPRCRCFPSPVYVDVPTTNSKPIEFGSDDAMKLVESLELEANKTPEYQDFRSNYFGSMASFNVNLMLRKPDVFSSFGGSLHGYPPERTREIADQLLSSFPRASIALPSPVQVSRSMRFPDGLPEEFTTGSTARDKGFTSVTISEEWRAYHARGRDSYRFDVTLPAGMRVVPHAREGEFLLHPGTKFEILSVDADARVINARFIDE